MRKHHQSGFVHLSLLLILIAGLIATVILIGKTQIFKSKAAGGKQVILLELKADNLTAIGGAKLNNNTLQFQKPTAACSQSLQAQIDGASAGSTLVAQPCLYRETVTISKPLILDGNGMAEIRGSDVFTEWEQKGNYWESKRQVASFHLNHTDFDSWCIDRNPACLKVEQVFLDGQQLTRVVNSGGNLRTGLFDVNDSGHILLADNPAGHLVEASVRQYWILVESSNVTVRNFVMRHAANEPQMGALKAESFGATVENNGIYQSHGTGIRLWGGASSNLVNNDIGWHGQIGMAGAPYLIKGNFIHHNNTEGYQPGHEAGAFKVTGASSGLWENNEVYSNKGFGMWCDIGCSDVIIKNNRVYDNEWSGIDYEVSRKADIQGNLVWRNALQAKDWGNNVYRSGIILNNAQESQVRDNILAWNRGGIITNSSDGSCGRYSDTNTSQVGWLTRETINNIGQNKVSNNKIIMGSGADNYGLGWVQQPDTAARETCAAYSGVLFKPESQNQGYNNQFWFIRGASFGWNNQNITSLDNYNRITNHTGNTLLSSSDKDNVLAANRIPAQETPCQAQNSNYTGVAVLKFDVSGGGDFSLWSHASSGAERIFWIQVDNDCAQQLNAGENLSWVKTANKQLSPGAHLIKVWGQNGVKIDRFLVSLNSNCTPAGTGDNCLPLTKPVNLQNTCSGDGRSAAISWNAVPHAEKYSISINKAPFTDWKSPQDISAEVNNTSYSFAVEPGIEYEWKVFAKSQAGDRSPDSGLPRFSCQPVLLPLVTTLTLSKTSGFINGETITLNFQTTGGAGNTTIHTSIQEGVTDPSQRPNCPPEICYKGFSSNTAQKTAKVPFYVEYLATDSQGHKEATKTMLVTAASIPTSAPTLKPGDLNRDQTVDTQDAQLFFEQYGAMNGYNYAEIIQNFGR